MPYTWALMSGFVVVAFGVLASTASIDRSFIRGVASACARLSSIGATFMVEYVLSDTVGHLRGFIFGGVTTAFTLVLWLAGNPEDRAIFFRLLLLILKILFYYPGVGLVIVFRCIGGWIKAGFSKAKNGIKIAAEKSYDAVKAYLVHPPPPGQGAGGPANARVGP